jgi:hypothetical protein
VHVPLRRSQLLVASQFLNRSDWRSPHGEVRTERMPQDVDTDVPQIRPSRHPQHQALYSALR